MGLFKKKTELNYLELTPQVKYTHEIKEDGLVNILIPRFKSEFMQRLIAKSPRGIYFRTGLDEYGSAVWLTIDGQKQVKVIADELLEKFGETINPVHQRLTMFLTQLYRAGFLSFKELKG